MDKFDTRYHNHIQQQVSAWKNVLGIIYDDTDCYQHRAVGVEMSDTGQI